MPEHNRDLQLLIDAAHASGKIAQRYFKAAPEIWDKANNAGPVTQADLEIDQMLQAELLSSRPDYGWLSEESEDDPKRLEHEHVFIIDPIDGTRAFIAGEKSFSHSLAIAKNGQIISAVVYVPMLDLLYIASNTQHTTLNGEAIHVSQQTQIDQATMLTARPNLEPKYWIDGTPPPVKRKFRSSLAYRMCLVAQGRYDSMLTLRACWEWDIAAGDLIIRMAGGISTDQKNTPLTFNSSTPKTKGCLCAGNSLHEQIRKKIRDR